jgi:hypothetical protein
MSAELTHARERMSKARCPLLALALIATVALISGCGSSTSTQTGAKSTSANAHKAAVKFAQCMRENGVGGFPDPSATRKLTIDAIANGSSLDTSTPAFTQALRACKELEPAGFMGSKRTAQQQQAALEFARCIRHNGVKDFPDPTPNGPLIDTGRIPSAADPAGMSMLHAAMQKCSDVAASAGVTR